MSTLRKHYCVQTLNFGALKKSERCISYIENDLSTSDLPLLNFRVASVKKIRSVYEFYFITRIRTVSKISIKILNRNKGYSYVPLVFNNSSKVEKRLMNIETI